MPCYNLHDGNRPLIPGCDNPDLCYNMFNYSEDTDHPGLVRVLREILSLLGCHAYTYPPVYQSEHQPQSDRYNESP